MLQEETEIVEVLKKSKNKLEESPQLCGLKPSEVKINDYEEDTLCYWGILAYQYVKDIGSFSYGKLVESLSKIRNNQFVCNYIAYILQKEYGISVAKLFIEASRCGREQQILPFVEDNLLFEDSIELEEVEDFLAAIHKIECQQRTTLLLYYAKLICLVQKQEDVFRSFMKYKKEIYFDFMGYFCREVYQIDSKIGDRMLIELLQEEQNGVEKVAVDFLDIGICYGFQIFEKYFDKIRSWKQISPKLSEKLISTYIAYLKNAERDDIKEKLIVEIEKIPVATTGEKISFLNAILCRDPLPEYLKRTLDGIVLYPFEKKEEMMKLFCRFFIAQENMDESEKLEYIHQIFIVNGYGRNYQDFFACFISMLRKMKDNPQIMVDYFMKSMFACGVENLYFALGLFKNAISLNCIVDIFQEREISVIELNLILRGFLYFSSDEKFVCQLSYEFSRTIPESMDAEPYLSVCMREVYENYRHTYYELAQQQENTHEKWKSELTKQILEKYQEDSIVQKTAYDIPDLNPSMERVLLLRKAKLEQNKETNKLVRKRSFFASMFQNQGGRVMKYGQRFAGIQYTQKDTYSYFVSPYNRFKSAREIPHTYIKDPVKWLRLCNGYLKERDNYCEINH